MTRICALLYTSLITYYRRAIAGRKHLWRLRVMAVTGNRLARWR